MILTCAVCHYFFPCKNLLLGSFLFRQIRLESECHFLKSPLSLVCLLLYLFQLQVESTASTGESCLWSYKGVWMSSFVASIRGYLEAAFGSLSSNPLKVKCKLTIQTYYTRGRMVRVKRCVHVRMTIFFVSKQIYWEIPYMRKCRKNLKEAADSFLLLAQLVYQEMRVLFVQLEELVSRRFIV